MTVHHSSQGERFPSRGSMHEQTLYEKLRAIRIEEVLQEHFGGKVDEEDEQLFDANEHLSEEG